MTVDDGPDGVDLADEVDGVDYAVAAYREDGFWQVEELAGDVLDGELDDVEALVDALRRLPGDGDAVALVAVDEDFFVVVRVLGPTTRVLLSDVTAGEDWDLAASVLDYLDVPTSSATTPTTSCPRATSACSRTSACPPPTSRCCSTTTTSTPTTCCPTSPAGSGFGPLFDDAVGLTTA